MKMLKRFVAVSMALMMVLGATACSKGNSSSQPAASDKNTKEPVTIEFWNGWTGPDADMLKKLVKEYNEKNTDGVTVKMDIMEFNSLTEKLATALASNTNPQLHLGFAVGEYSIQHQYIPIDDIFEKTNLQKSDFNQDILKNSYSNGHLYGLPFQLTSEYLFWNKDLFKKAGLDPDKAPATWEDLIEYSKKIDGLGDNIFGGGISFNDGIVLGSIMQDYGGGVAGADGASYKSVLTDPLYFDGNKQAIEMLQKFTRQNKKNISTAKNESSFLAGRCGMMIGGSWELAGCKKNKLNYGISLMPAGPKGMNQPATPVSMCVMKNTTGRKLEAAYSFLNYWNNNIDNKIAGNGNSPAFQWTKEQGYQPYLLSVANDPKLTSDKDYKVTSSYIQHYKTYYPASFWNAYLIGTQVLQPIGENVGNEKMTVEQAIVAADKDLNKMITQMKQTEKSGAAATSSSK